MRSVSATVELAQGGAVSFDNCLSVREEPLELLLGIREGTDLQRGET